ncbi:hypothetical protein [Thalassolituus sp.]|jgi:hypothetical protein|uniref:Nmad2 family putative nucleotide modification protein n=1 Tax=Thalassolituus sp. TaxID=2030822 RepID=UPI0032D90668
MAYLHSYIVAYDSGFAPNPFGGYCTLATCKPEIRKHANIGDWVIGTGSNDSRIKRGGHIVYAMKITEAISFNSYWSDARFQKKKPNLNSSYVKACGDNIYHQMPDNTWVQLDSYHSNKDGSANPNHVRRDTGVDRVLISDNYIYFGAEGPLLPEELQSSIVLKGRGRKKTSDITIISKFESWLEELNLSGYQGKPYDMIKEAKK